MNAYTEVKVWINLFLTSATGANEWLASRSHSFTFRKTAPGTYEWVLEQVKKLKERTFWYVTRRQIK